MSREPFLKVKAQYSWPPCTNLFISSIDIANIIYILLNMLGATLMRRSTVLSLPICKCSQLCLSVLHNSTTTLLSQVRGFEFCRRLHRFKAAKSLFRRYRFRVIFDIVHRPEHVDLAVVQELVPAQISEVRQPFNFLILKQNIEKCNIGLKL